MFRSVKNLKNSFTRNTKSKEKKHDFKKYAGTDKKK